METQTMQSSESSSDFELYEAVEAPSPDSTSANEGSERTTSKESASTDNNAVKQQTKETKQSDNAPASKAETNQNQTKEKFVTRGEKREETIRNLISENKKVLEEITKAKSLTQTPANDVQKATQTQSEPVFVEKPTPPHYTREQLQTMAQRAQAEGNQEGLNAVQAELAKWDKHDIELKFWKLENGKKMESFQQAWNDSWKKAVTKHPTLGDKESPLYKDADNLAKRFPEVLNRQQGDGQYILAEIAAMRLERKSHASEVGALKEQIKTLTDQLNASQKKIQPAGQSSKPNLSSSGESGSPEEKLAKKLGIR
jgi:hypothetical protein